MNPYLAKLQALSRENHDPSILTKLTKPSPAVCDELTKPTKPGFVSFVSDQGMRISDFGESEASSHYAHLLSALHAACPPFVEHDRWRRAVVDAEGFLAKWGGVAHQLNWNARELFGLHPVPERPPASYSRLGRYDETGLIWLLRGRQVIALTETTAAIQSATAVLTYRKLNKPALGPLGDSLDHWGGA
jgi:hypothetical protein